MLLNASIRAADPAGVAAVLAACTGGHALRFPPFPDSWIAFAGEDDGRTVGVYPLTHRLVPGPGAVACETGAANAAPSATHAAIASPLPAERLMAHGAGAGWTTRCADRGPLACIEMWIEDRVLVEWLDPEMRAAYHATITNANWAAMFATDGAP